MQAAIESNKQDPDDKMMKVTEDLKAMLESAIMSMMDHINMLKPSPAQIDSPKPPDPNTVVPSNRRIPQLYGGNLKKWCHVDSET